jgi:AbrB family looped-hinge helix DNA binding protein
MATNYITVSTKGQVIIPAELREQLHIEPGTKMAVERAGGAIVLRPITDQFIDSLYGSAKGLGLSEVLQKMRKQDKKR